MLSVGLTGGLATGKSFVGGILKELGCHLIEADALGHKVLLPDGEAYAAVVAHFGRDILTAAGEIDRGQLAVRVFSDPEELNFLNKQVHPAVYQLKKAMFEQIQAEDPRAIAVFEAAILIETGSYRDLDKLIVTVCDEETQIARAMARGLTEEAVRARLKRQLPLLEKAAYADFIVNTSESREETREATRRVYDSLRSLNS